MTREEAINTLGNFKRYISGGGVADRKANEAIDMAIKALQAEPKYGHWIERAKCEYRCDQCGKIVFADDDNELNYCCCCGAKMKRRDL